MCAIIVMSKQKVLCANEQPLRSAELKSLDSKQRLLILSNQGYKEKLWQRQNRPSQNPSGHC